MTRPKPREVLFNFALLATAMVGIGFVYKLGDAIGMTRWLTGVLGGSTVWLCVMVVTYRRLVPFQKKGSLLLALGFVVLSIASAINEYAVHFFEPSGIYLLVAVLPSFVFAAYHEYKHGSDLDSERGGGAERGAGPALGRISTTYHLLVSVRVAAAVCMLAVLFVFPLSVSVKAKWLTSAMICGFVLADGIISFARPHLCRQAPSNRLAALVWKASVFTDPDKPRANTLISIVIIAAVFGAVSAKLLGYW